jgi:hypothetical protein
MLRGLVVVTVKHEMYKPNVNFKRQILIYCFGEYMTEW